MRHHTQARTPKAIRNVNRQASMARMLAAAALLFAFAQAEADQLTVTAANWYKNAVYNIQINSSKSNPLTPVIPGTTTAINSTTDAGTHGNFDALVWVTNSYCNSRDLIVADASKQMIVRYQGASTVAGCYIPPPPPPGGTPLTISPTAQTLFAYATSTKPGPRFPNGLSADAYGNLFAISSAIVGSYAGVWALPFDATNGKYDIAPVLIDKTFGGTNTKRLVETVVASQGTSLWNIGDLLVLIDDWTSTTTTTKTSKGTTTTTTWSTTARVNRYAATSIYGGAGTPGPISSGLPLSGPTTVAIPTSAFIALFKQLKIAQPSWTFFSLFSDALFGMDLLPATTPSAHTGVLFTTGGGIIAQFDTVQDTFLTTNYANIPGGLLQKVRVGLFSNVPLAFVTQVLSGSTLQGQILVLGAPISGKNNQVGVVTSGVMEPVGLAVVQSGSQTVPPNQPFVPFTLAPLGASLVSMTIDNLGTGTLSGVSTQTLCEVQPDPRVSATVTGGVLTSWSCTGQDLQIGAGTTICPTFPSAYIPGSVCGHSGAGANAFAVVEGAATGLDPNDNNTLIAVSANADTALPGPGNLECTATAFSATGQIPLIAWGTRSDLTTIEGTIPEDTLGTYPVLGGAPGFLTELTGGCDTSTSSSRGISIVAFGLGLSTPPQSAKYQTFLYQLLAQKFAALNQTISTATIKPASVATTLQMDIGSVSGAQFFVNEAQSTGNVTTNMNCALVQIYTADKYLRSNLPDFSSNLIVTSPGGGNPNPAGDIDGRLANLFLSIFTEFLGNSPPAPQAPPLFLIPASAEPSCGLMPPPYSVGGTVTGLTVGSQVMLVNQSNGDMQTVTGGGTGTDSFTFLPADLNPGAAYNIAVATQPLTETCSSTNASGNIGEGNVSGVLFACTANTPPSLSISYYTISTSDPDPGHLGSGTCSDYVTSALGTDGLPVLNTPLESTSCGNSPADVNSSNEITWWSPMFNTNVTSTGSDTVSLLYSNPNFYPPNGTGNCDGSCGGGYQAAILSGQLTVTVPEGAVVSFILSADDMEFVYLDGAYVCGLGGVHPATSTTCTTTSPISAGSHPLEVFYVDMATTGAVLDFNVTGPNIIITP
jgi:hypothetical protein